MLSSKPEAREDTDRAENQMDLDARLDDAVFEKPAPRHPMTGAQRARIQAQNRRREYLERNPAYFDNLDHELAGTILSCLFRFCFRFCFRFRFCFCFFAFYSRDASLNQR